jgi:hypothetical protein
MQIPNVVVSSPVQLSMTREYDIVWVGYAEGNSQTVLLSLVIDNCKGELTNKFGACIAGRCMTASALSALASTTGERCTSITPLLNRVFPSGHPTPTTTGVSVMFTSDHVTVMDSIGYVASSETPVSPWPGNWSDPGRGQRCAVRR